MCIDLQWYGQVYQVGDQWYCYEEDYDYVVGGEDLVVVVWWQVIFGIIDGDGLLGMYYDGVGEIVQQYDEGDDEVYYVDFFVIY